MTAKKRSAGRRGYDPEAARRALDEEQERAENYGERIGWYDKSALDELDIKVYEIKKGENFIRFLPQTKGRSEFFYRVCYHYTPMGIFLCPNAHELGDGYCPICEEYRTIKEKRNKTKDDEKYMSQLSYVQRYVYFGLDVDSEESIEEGLHMFILPISLHFQIVEQSKDRSGEVILIFDPDEGKEVGFKKIVTGSGRNPWDTKYQLSGIYDPASDYYVEDEILDAIPDFEDVLLLRTPEELEELLPDVFVDGNLDFARRGLDDDDDEDESPRRKKGGSKKKTGSTRPPRGREDEEEGEEETRPARKRTTDKKQAAPGRRRTKAETEEDDDIPDTFESDEEVDEEEDSVDSFDEQEAEEDDKAAKVARARSKLGKNSKRR